MMMRSCVRRFGRLPEEVIVDRGADFRSVYFASFLVDRGVTLTFRPSGHARYGSEAERFFGVFKTQWLSARPGNLASVKDARAVSSTHAPRAQTRLEVLDLLREIEQYRAWHASWIPSGSSTSPDHRMTEGLRTYACSGIRQVFDDAFLIASAVDETRIKLDVQRGLKIGDRYYWHGALAGPDIRTSQLRVRRDPEDYTRVYVNTGKQWITCHHSNAQFAAASDPLALLARSILVHDGGKAREVAREESDMALVAELRKADEARGLSVDARPSAPSDPDPFDGIDDVGIS
jgi:putative transposase